MASNWNWISEVDSMMKWRWQKAVNWIQAEKIPLTKFCSTSCCAAEIPFPCSEDAFHSSSWLFTDCRLGPSCHAYGSPHIPYAWCVRGPPACPVRPTVYSLPAGLGAKLWRGATSCGITKTIVPYGGQKELQLAFSPHNKRSRVLRAAAVTLRLQFLHNNWRKRESHFIPI